MAGWGEGVDGGGERLRRFSPGPKGLGVDGAVRGEGVDGAESAIPDFPSFSEGISSYPGSTWSYSGGISSY